MRIDYEANFRLKDCMQALGVEERGRVERRIAENILTLSDEYIPFAEGNLKDSGHIEDGNSVVWNTPYARYQWNGIVYIDPDLNCAGFKTDAGWRSRKGVEKIPTNRKLDYQGGSLRGPRWVDRMLRDGGREEIEQAAREAAKR